jgi:CRP/FNR family transcriptional regulator, cyclic AMP receptor protein
VHWRLLEGVPPEEVRQLLALARRRSFRRGEVVFHRLDPSDSLHLVVKGRFAIRVMTPLGETVTIALRGPGDAFGEMGVLGDAPPSATVEALEEAETFCLYKREFERVRREHPTVNAVLRRLVELAALYGSSNGPVAIPLTQEELAGLAGNGVLRDEEKRGTVEIRRGTTVVLDREAIARRAR